MVAPPTPLPPQPASSSSSSSPPCERLSQSFHRRHSPKLDGRRHFGGLAPSPLQPPSFKNYKNSQQTFFPQEKYTKYFLPPFGINLFFSSSYVSPSLSLSLSHFRIDLLLNTAHVLFKRHGRTLFSFVRLSRRYERDRTVKIY